MIVIEDTIINKLDKMINDIVKDGTVPVKTADCIRYKNYKIFENSNKLYTIISDVGAVLFKDVFWVKSAMALVDLSCMKKRTCANIIYKLDSDYAKHINDMRLYKKMYEFVKEDDIKSIFYSRFIESKCFAERCASKINKKNIINR